MAGGEHLSNAQKRRAIELANRMKKLMDEHFLKKSDPAVHAEITAMRTELETMGFKVVCEYRVDPAKLTLDTEVQLLLPRKVDPENIN